MLRHTKSRLRLRQQRLSSECDDEQGHTMQTLESCSFYDCLYDPKFVVNDKSNEAVGVMINQLEKEIDKLPTEDREPYCIALKQEIKQKTHYVRSRNFLLMFLRADRFDVPKAAKRVAMYFKHKMDLFGVEKLPRRIRQDDLNDDDKKVLLSGFFRFCDFTDCGGRLVLVTQLDRLRSLGLLNDHYTKNMSRVVFYYLFKVEENEESQKKGVVVIRWCLNSSLTLKDYKVFFDSNFFMVRQALPARPTATHSCCSSTASTMCASLMDSLLNKYRHQLCKIHGPTAGACFSGLSKFGIDVHSLLLNHNGDFNVQAFQKQLEDQRQSEFAVMLQKMGGTCPSVVRNQVEKVKQNNTNDNISALSELSEKKNSPPVGFETGRMTNLREQVAAVSRKNTASKNLGEQHLPRILMGILKRNTAEDAIWWVRGGMAFAIQMDRFPETVLLTEFGGIQMGSFLRRLRRWGFQRLPNDDASVNYIVFKHPLFQKDLEQLLEQWDMEGKKDKFPTKLMKILDNSNNAEKSDAAIWWVKDGKAFAINKKKFDIEILRNHFEGLKFTSFQRNLQRWGFTQIIKYNFGPNIVVYQHPFFQENSRDILNKLHLKR